MGIGQEVQRRAFSRVPARLRVTFAWQPPGCFAVYETIDIGAGGALVQRIDAFSPLPTVGALGEVAFNLEGHEIRSEGRVARVTATGFAVALASVSPSLEERLVNWVQRQQARAKAPSGV